MICIIPCFQSYNHTSNIFFYKTTLDLIFKWIPSHQCHYQSLLFNHTLYRSNRSAWIKWQGDPPIIQCRLIVTSVLIILSREILLYLHLLHNIPSFILTNKGKLSCITTWMNRTVARENVTIPYKLWRMREILHVQLHSYPEPPCTCIENNERHHRQIIIK